MKHIELIGLGISVYTRIARLALEEKQVNYSLNEVDIFAEAGPPASYLSLHPFGMIPCLRQDDFVLYETGAITRYVDECGNGAMLQPENTRQRAQMNQVEQMPGFLIGISLFSILVNGTVGAVLGLAWVIWRYQLCTYTLILGSPARRQPE